MTAGEQDADGAPDAAADEEVRRCLRDLIPDYSGPPDPLLRVGASIRRRRARRRALLAVGSAATAAAMVATVPALLTSVVPAEVSGEQQPPGAAPEQPAAGAPAPTGAPDSPAPPPVVHPVASGTVAGAAWAVGSTSPGGGAHRCLYSDDEIFARDTVCFDAWRPGRPVTWSAQVITGRGGTRVTRVAGVAPAPAAAVAVQFAEGPPVRAAAVRTPTDPAARFFALVVPGGAVVRSVTVLAGDGTELGPPATDPGTPGCRPTPDNACAAPPG